MVTNEVRVPKQKRSIQKYGAIVRAGYDLFCRQGYYKTNTAEIAKRAGVSVGVVYSYFQDKKDILMQVIDVYLMELEQRFSTVLDEMTAGQELESVIDRFAESLRASHRMNQAAHDEFLALALRNEEIRKKFDSFEDKILQELFRELSKRQNIAKVHLMERLRLSYGVIEHLCHDTIWASATQEEWETAKGLSISMISTLLLNHT